MIKRLVVGLLTAALAGWAALPAWASGPELPRADCDPGRLIDQVPAVFDQLGVERAWKLSRGGVRVAVVDSGVAANNTHLTDAVLPGWDAIDTLGTGRVDEYGQGTIVAAQIAARDVSGSGLVGVAPDATILPVRVYLRPSSEAEEGPTPTRTAQGVRWGADNGAKIIVVPHTTTVDDPRLREAVTHATNSGALVVASAGEREEDVDNDAPRYPAAYPEALSVTGVDSAGLPGELAFGEHVDVAAPGAEVLSANREGGDCRYAEQPSAAYATAYAGGVAALVAARYPDEKPAQWKYRLEATALRPTLDARDPWLGWGVVAPYDALNFFNDGTLLGPPNPLHPRPTPPVVPAMTRPEPAYDPRPEQLVRLGVIAGISTLVALASLLLARRFLDQGRGPLAAGATTRAARPSPRGRNG